MARLSKISRVLNIFIYFCILLCCFTKIASANVELDESNWQQILEGEWMIEFYAPWCPACNALAPAWQELSNRARAKSLDTKAASVDVTKSPGLSGRFMVTALPTIYHVKEGEFRKYKGPRDADSMIDYVEWGKWKQTEAMPSWKAPDSPQMGLVANLFKLSQFLRNVHNMLMETYGLPTWGSYLIFALTTILVGTLLGLAVVCCIDMIYPERSVDQFIKPQAELDKLRKEKISDDEQDLINDDIVDDAEQAPDSEAEKNSPSDTSEDDKEKEIQASGDENKTDKQEVRKRRPRKAD